MNQKSRLKRKYRWPMREGVITKEVYAKNYINAKGMGGGDVKDLHAS